MEYTLNGMKLQAGTTLLDYQNRALIAPSGDFNSARVTTATQAMLEALFPELFAPEAQAAEYHPYSGTQAAQQEAEAFEAVCTGLELCSAGVGRLLRDMEQVLKKLDDK